MRTDRELLDALAAALGKVDPPPPQLTIAAEAVFSLHRNTFNIAVLSTVADSAVRAPAGMRGSSGTRSLRFIGSGTTVDLQLDVVAGLGLHAFGLVHPARPGSTAVTSWSGGTHTAEIDTVGWFQASMPCGPIRFMLCQPGRPDLTTGWFVG